MSSRLLYWAAWPHEMCHYLTARALGVEARVETSQTWLGERTPAQDLAITAAPVAVGLALLVAGVVAALRIGGLAQSFAQAGAMLGAIWLLGCVGDFGDLLKTSGEVCRRWLERRQTTYT